jgi:hypothetical protein
MTRISRRRFTGSIVAAGVSFTSGCLGLTGLGGSGSNNPESVVRSYIDLVPTLYGKTDKWPKKARPLFHTQSTFFDDISELDWFRRYEEAPAIDGVSVSTTKRDLTVSQIRSLDLTTKIQGPVQDLTSPTLVDGTYSIETEQYENNSLFETELRFLVAKDDGEWRIVSLVSTNR